jgi:hypothetical protein
VGRGGCNVGRRAYMDFLKYHEQSADDGTVSLISVSIRQADGPYILLDL